MYDARVPNEFANAHFLKHSAQVSKLLEPTAKDAQAKVKPADKMLVLPPLFDGEKPGKAKTHFQRSINILNSKLKKVV